MNGNDITPMQFIYFVKFTISNPKCEAKYNIELKLVDADYDNI